MCFRQAITVRFFYSGECDGKRILYFGLLNVFAQASAGESSAEEEDEEEGEDSDYIEGEEDGDNEEEEVHEDEDGDGSEEQQLDQEVRWVPPTQQHSHTTASTLCS